MWDEWSYPEGVILPVVTLGTIRPEDSGAARNFIYFFIALVVPYSALTDYDRSVVLVLDDRHDPQLWGHCRSPHNSSMICFFVVAVVSLWHPGDVRDV